MSAVKPSIYSVGEVSGVDFRPGIVSIDIYEDVMVPTVTARINIASSGGGVDGKSLYSGAELRGGEPVSFRIEPNSDGNIPIDFSRRPLVINKVQNVIRDAQREFLTLSLFSLEAYENETTFLQRKFSKEATISQHVEDIIAESFTRPLIREVDAAQNKYGFLGNNTKPFHMMTNLASKAVPASAGSGTAGFFFFQTREGFSFRGVDTLAAQEPKAKFFYSEVMQKDCLDFFGSSELPSLDYKIIKYDILRNQDLVGNLQRGAYSTDRRIFDPIGHFVTGGEAAGFGGENYFKKSGGLQSLGARLGKLGDFSLGFDDGLSFSEKPSMILTDVFDFGTVDEGVTQDLTRNTFDYSSQSRTRYNTIFTQMLSVMVPLNSNIHAGDIVEISIPNISPKKRVGLDKSQVSGLYMVKELNHHFDTQGSYTTMVVMRDSYGKRKT